MLNELGTLIELRLIELLIELKLMELVLGRERIEDVKDGSRPEPMLVGLGICKVEEAEGGKLVGTELVRSCVDEEPRLREPPAPTDTLTPIPRERSADETVDEATEEDSTGENT